VVAAASEPHWNTCKLVVDVDTVAEVERAAACTGRNRHNCNTVAHTEADTHTWDAAGTWLAGDNTVVLVAMSAVVAAADFCCPFFGSEKRSKSPLACQESSALLFVCQKWLKSARCVHARIHFIITLSTYRLSLNGKSTRHLKAANTGTTFLQRRVNG